MCLKLLNTSNLIHISLSCSTYSGGGHLYLALLNDVSDNLNYKYVVHHSSKEKNTISLSNAISLKFRYYVYCSENPLKLSDDRKLSLLSDSQILNNNDNHR